MLKNSILSLCLVSLCILTGCSDYMNNLDTVTLEAGDSQAHNRMVHAKEPFNPNSSNVLIDADGQRTADAMVAHREGLKKLPPPRVTNLTINSN